MRALRACGLDKVAYDAVDKGTPFLGVCVGMQLLYEGSDESPDEPGRKAVPVRTRRSRPAAARMRWRPPSISKVAAVASPHQAAEMEAGVAKRMGH